MGTRVAFLWVDHSGKRSRTRLHSFPEGDNDAAVSLALTVAPLLEALSDARLTHFIVEHDYTNPAAVGPQPDSSVYSSAVYFYRNGDACSSLSVPAPPALLPEVTGPYAGVRITRARLFMLGLLSTVENMVSGAIDPTGRPYPDTFTVGGTN